MYITLLELGVQCAFHTAQCFGLDMHSHMPSLAAHLSAPAYGHPILPANDPRASSCLGTNHGVSTMADIHLMAVASPGNPLLDCPTQCCEHCAKVRHCRTMYQYAATGHLSHFFDSNWGLSWAHLPHGAHLYSAGADGVSPASCIQVLPEQASVRDSLHVFTNPQNLLTTSDMLCAMRDGLLPLHLEEYNNSWPAFHPPPAVDALMVCVWTDGSMLDNGLESCQAGSVWITNLGLSRQYRLSGVPLANNVAELVAVVQALLHFCHRPLLVHTDLSFVIGLASGGLLDLEHDGWPGFLWLGPMGNLVNGGLWATYQPLFKTFLWLLCSHNAALDFVKVAAHSVDACNNDANALAKDAVHAGHLCDVSALCPPHGWVDSAPALANGTIHFFSGLIHHLSLASPLSGACFKHVAFAWTWQLFWIFNEWLDLVRYLLNIWKINIPVGLWDILWQSIMGHLPIGPLSQGKFDKYHVCPCGVDMSLTHVLQGCASYPLQWHWGVVGDTVVAIVQSYGVAWHKTMDLDAYWPCPWFPLLMFLRLEWTHPLVKSRKILGKSCSAQELLRGSFYWLIWKHQMADIFDNSAGWNDYKFGVEISAILAAIVGSHGPPTPSSSGGPPGPSGTPSVPAFASLVPP